MKNSTDKLRGKKSGSVIVSALDVLATKAVSLLGSGAIGGFFTSYSPSLGRIAGGVADSSLLGTRLDSFRRPAARKIESSAVHELYARLIRYLISVRLKVYGTAAVTFFLYAALIELLRFAVDGFTSIPTKLIAFLLLAASSVTLIFSRLPLFTAICTSRIGRGLLAVTGNRPDVYEPLTPKGRCNIAFLIGTVLGLFTYLVPADVLGLVLLRTVWALTVLHSPEFGIVSLCFLLPFDKTITLAVEVIIIAFSFGVKLLLGKRAVRAEAVDLAAFMFVPMLLIGGLFSVSQSSIKPMLVYLCFMSVYFLITGLLRSVEWFNRCITAAVLGGGITAGYGILQYVTGSIAFSAKWLDSTMFAKISGRAISTLENPNVLGEYLVMLIPMAAVLFIFGTRGSGKRLAAFGSFSLMLVCLVLTWSRGAWLGFAVGALLFMLIMNKRTLHFFWVLLLCIPFASAVLPESVALRISSIGNLADSSTAYRFNIWLGALKMLPERMLSGIGIGQGAWQTVYPEYALSGIEGAPHSHSLYLQIWIELGFTALVIFLVFILLLFMSQFTMYKTLSEAGSSLVPRIYTAPVKNDVTVGGVSVETSDFETAERAKLGIRMNGAAPLCGIVGVMIQGLTDNIWYNYRVYLMFWICLGLCAAYSAVIREKLVLGNSYLFSDDPSSFTAEIGLSAHPKKRVGTAGSRDKENV